MKTAVMNGSITVAQVKELKANADTLKSVRENQTPGAPVDLLTPYRAVSKMKAIMATVDAKDRETFCKKICKRSWQINRQRLPRRIPVPGRSSAKTFSRR